MRMVVDQPADRVQPEAKSPKAVRVHISLTENHYGELKIAAADAGVDVSEFVRSALRVYAYLQKERSKGKSIYIGQDDKAEKEVVFLD